MNVIAAAAIYGAALGLSVRPPLRAVLWSTLSVGVVQYALIWLSGGMMFRPGEGEIARIIQAYAGSGATDLVPTMSAATFAAMFTALITAIAQAGERRRRTRRLSTMED